MWHDNYGMGWPMWAVMILGLIALWVLVALLVRHSFNGRHPGSFPSRSALAELDARLARGDISTDDYTAARRLISDGH
jgi:uncharacterized membrane protein